MIPKHSHSYDFVEKCRFYQSAVLFADNLPFSGYIFSKMEGSHARTQNKNTFSAGGGLASDQVDTTMFGHFKTDSMVNRRESAPQPMDARMGLYEAFIRRLTRSLSVHLFWHM